MTTPTPPPREIERKYLIRDHRGDVSQFFLPGPSSGSRIDQVYLVPTVPGTTERVRMRSDLPLDGVTYTHTVKRHIEDGINEEIEREITLAEYTNLLPRRDPFLRTVSKTRWVFSFEGQTFELDLFLGPLRGLILLEIELPSMDVPVVLPPFDIVREVTKERAFSNAALAARNAWSPEATA